MIHGVVTSQFDAVISLVVMGSNGQRELIDAVVDTGFDGWLSLPHSLVRELDLPWQSLGRALLADGSECEYDIHDGAVLWDSAHREISIDACDSEPLVGMRLLEGFEVVLPVRKGSPFTIAPILD